MRMHICMHVVVGGADFHYCYCCYYCFYDCDYYLLLFAVYPQLDSTSCYSCNRPLPLLLLLVHSHRSPLHYCYYCYKEW